LSKKQGPMFGCQAHVCRRSGCQAHEHSLQVRELLGIVSQGAQLQLQGSETSCPDLLLKPWKGSGAAEGLLSREGAHFLGWDMHVGNEGL
jgi:hypothetical protein